MEGGTIFEDGTPEELMSKTDGRFNRMYKDQRVDAITQSAPTKSTKLVGKFSMRPSDSLQTLVIKF